MQYDIYIREKLHNRIRNSKSIMREREQKNEKLHNRTNSNDI
nr:MAG TPA: hypothetical protein [Caudoviricetes sp.]